MLELGPGTRVTARTPKGARSAQVQDSRAGFYLCLFEDGSSAWVDARDVSPAEPVPSPGGFAPPISVPAQSLPAAGSFNSPLAAYPCGGCGRPGADYFPRGTAPMHRACANLGPDVLPWPWLLLAYGVVLPFGCTFIGALLASIPYYVWRNEYPLKAKAYNRHVWIAFACSAALWLSLGALSSLLARKP